MVLGIIPPVTHAVWAPRRDSICRCFCCWRLVRLEGSGAAAEEDEDETAVPAPLLLLLPPLESGKSQFIPRSADGRSGLPSLPASTRAAEPRRPSSSRSDRKPPSDTQEAASGAQSSSKTAKARRGSQHQHQHHRARAAPKRFPPIGWLRREGPPLRRHWRKGEGGLTPRAPESERRAES